MKNRLIISLFIILFSQRIFPMSFTEQTDNEWGYSGRCCKSEYKDIDNDGLLDLLIGVIDGTISHYEQTSDTSFDFQLVTHDFCNRNAYLYATPTIYDIDDDGLLDLLIGSYHGEIYHYEQTAVSSYNFDLVSDNFLSIDVGMFSYPILTNIDDDGRLDLLIGEGSGYEDDDFVCGGNINYYEQMEIGSEEFQLVSENFSDITVGNCSYPTIYDIDGNGKLDLIIGNRWIQDTTYRVAHYEQSEVGDENFDLVTDNFNNFNDNIQIPILTLFDISGDGNPELSLGKYTGGVGIYIQNSVDPYEFTFDTEMIPMFTDEHFISAEFNDIDSDGNYDLLIGNSEGTITLCEQISYGSSQFETVSKNFNEISVSGRSRPKLLDLDADGLLDLFIGAENGIAHYEQTEENSYNFDFVESSFSGIYLQGDLYPVFADIDHDNHMDLLIAKNHFGSESISHYEQVGEDLNQFECITYNFTDNFSGLENLTRHTPTFNDLNADGFWDVIIGFSDGGLNHYKQENINNYDFDDIDSCIEEIDNGINSFPTFVDINRDGLDDLLIAYSSGAIHYYQRNYEIVAQFSVYNNSGTAPLNVEFCDNSLGNPTQWEWDFDGDGLIDSYDQNPEYVYNEPGYYDVSLTAYSNDSEESISKEAFIYVYPENGVFGIISNDTVWTEDVAVVGDILIEDGVSLTINPGVTVTFDNNLRIDVQGRIIAEGTLEDSITFTIADSTNISDPNIDEGGWQGVRFENTLANNDSSFIAFCRFEYGKAFGEYGDNDNFGAAIYVSYFDKLTINNCSFSNNWISSSGAGIIALDNSSITIKRCSFTENKMLRFCLGLSIYLKQSYGTIENCMFYNNKARLWNSIYNEWEYSISGIFMESSSPLIINNLFANNAGTPLKLLGSNPTIINNTLVSNIGGFAGAIFAANYSYPTLINTIIYNNETGIMGYDNQFYLSDNSGLETNNCCLQDSFPGIDILLEDPCFVSPNNEPGVSQDGFEADWTFLCNSNCINRGTLDIENISFPELDLGYQPRIYDGFIDLGAYEYQFTNTSDDLLSDHYSTKLSRNYPNPFNPRTNIAFAIGHDSMVQLNIYNVKGQLVRKLVNDNLTKGEYNFQWDGADNSNKHVGCGVYFYVLRLDDNEQLTRKMILIE